MKFRLFCYTMTALAVILLAAVGVLAQAPAPQPPSVSPTTLIDGVTVSPFPGMTVPITDRGSFRFAVRLTSGSIVNRNLQGLPLAVQVISDFDEVKPQLSCFLDRGECEITAQKTGTVKIGFLTRGTSVQELVINFTNQPRFGLGMLIVPSATQGEDGETITASAIFTRSYRGNNTLQVCAGNPCQWYGLGLGEIHAGQRIPIAYRVINPFDDRYFSVSADLFNSIEPGVQARGFGHLPWKMEQRPFRFEFNEFDHSFKATMNYVDPNLDYRMILIRSGFYLELPVIPGGGTFTFFDHMLGHSATLPRGQYTVFMIGVDPREPQRMNWSWSIQGLDIPSSITIR